MRYCFSLGIFNSLNPLGINTKRAIQRLNMEVIAFYYNWSNVKSRFIKIRIADLSTAKWIRNVFE